MPYLTPEKVAEVQQYLAAGESVPGVCRALNISDWTVRQIKAGTHRLRYRNPQRYASQDAWKKRLTPEQRAKRKAWRCSCGLLIRTKVCRRCAVVKGVS